MAARTFSAFGHVVGGACALDHITAVRQQKKMGTGEVGEPTSCSCGPRAPPIAAAAFLVAATMACYIPLPSLAKVWHPRSKLLPLSFRASCRHGKVSALREIRGGEGGPNENDGNKSTHSHVQEAIEAARQKAVSALPESQKSPINTRTDDISAMMMGTHKSPGATPALNFGNDGTAFQYSQTSPGFDQSQSNLANMFAAQAFNPSTYRRLGNRQPTYLDDNAMLDGSSGDKRNSAVEVKGNRFASSSFGVDRSSSNAYRDSFSRGGGRYNPRGSRGRGGRSRGYSNFNDRFSSSTYQSTWRDQGNSIDRSRHYREGDGESKFGRKPREDQYSFTDKVNDVDFAKIALPKIVKELYREHPEIANMDTRDRERIWADNDIVVRPSRSYKGKMLNPITEFYQSSFPEYIVRRFEELRFSTPTPIQMQGWPIAMAGNDLLGLASTGSGKTLAFALPSIVHLEGQPPLPSEFASNPTVLVIAPTRELAQQIEKDYLTFGCMNSGSRQRYGYRPREIIKVACLYGGASRRYQEFQLRNKPQILVATPGRLLDFITDGVVSLRTISFVVIDEADRMLDMGFEPQILKIMGQIRNDRQVLFFSATWPREIQALARRILRDPVTIQIGDTSLKPSRTVNQTLHFVEEDDKTMHLKDLLRELSPGVRVLIFTEQKRTAEIVRQDLASFGLRAATMHGDKNQRERDLALKDFRSGRMPFLIASDVAARGLDVKDIKVVVNYDMPKDITTYVHRIGRTGRAGQNGLSISFITPSYRMSRQLLDMFDENGLPIPDELRRFARGGFKITTITPELRRTLQAIPADGTRELDEDPRRFERRPQFNTYQEGGGSRRKDDFFNPRRQSHSQENSFSRHQYNVHHGNERSYAANANGIEKEDFQEDQPGGRRSPWRRERSRVGAQRKTKHERDRERRRYSRDASRRGR